MIGDWQNMDGYELVHGSEGAGHKGVTGVRIYVRQDPDTKAALEKLRKIERTPGNLAQTPIEKENAIWYEVGRLAERVRSEQALRLDPDVAQRMAQTKTEFAKAFEDAGLGAIFMEPIPNGYFPEGDPYGKFEPWFKVATRIGYVVIGWRKRVIHLDWSGTVLRAATDPNDFYQRPRVPRADELFPEEKDTTAEGTMIHAWGYEKATAYLKVLREHFERQPA